MAQVTNTYSTYDSVGQREDLSDIIYSISPTDTQFMSSIGKEKATAVLHEWQTDALAAAALTYIEDELVNEYAFIRACPEVARHGVIESIKVTRETYMDEWRRLATIMKEQDPNGCMLLQPFIDATSSMVLAPNQYAVVGEGHDDRFYGLYD